MADIRELVRRKAAAAGIDPTHALTMASIETGGSFDPGMTSPTGYKGLFQFGPSEWKTWGGGKDINDPEANSDAFVGYHNQIRDQMKANLGRDPTPQELYLGWQQGAAGATSLIQNPDKRAGDLVPPANLVANGMSPDWKASQVTGTWSNTYDKHQASVTGGQYVRTLNDPAMAVPDAAPADPQVAGAYTTPAAPPPAGLLAPQAKANPYAPISQGMGLMAAGSPQQTWQPQGMAPLQAHRPGMQPISLPDFLNRQTGLLG